MTTSTALISPNGIYRYQLMRKMELNPQPLKERCVLFIMHNPSSADEKENDPTTRRCMEFARSWGFNVMKIGNLFAYRDPEKGQLFKAKRAGVDIVGPRNDWNILLMAREANMVVCAWGAHADDSEQRAQDVVRLLLTCHVRLHLIERCKSGGPAHPLYLHSRCKPQIYMERK